jgi:hypothetical protein
MSIKEKKLLQQVVNGDISLEDFYLSFPTDVRKDKAFVISEISKALSSKTPKGLDLCINLIWLSGNCADFTLILNELLLNTQHRHHQFVVKCIQDNKNPSSIHHIDKALAKGFEHLSYTCSEPQVIAKWFSWALYSIGTPEAIAIMKKYANSNDEGIKSEMTYRLSKMR